MIGLKFYLIFNRIENPLCVLCHHKGFLCKERNLLRKYLFY